MLTVEQFSDELKKLLDPYFEDKSILSNFIVTQSNRLKLLQQNEHMNMELYKEVSDDCEELCLDLGRKEALKHLAEFKQIMIQPIKEHLLQPEEKDYQNIAEEITLELEKLLINMDIKEVFPFLEISSVIMKQVHHAIDVHPKGNRFSELFSVRSEANKVRNNFLDEHAKVFVDDSSEDTESIEEKIDKLIGETIEPQLKWLIETIEQKDQEQEEERKQREKQKEVYKIEESENEIFQKVKPVVEAMNVRYLQQVKESINEPTEIRDKLYEDYYVEVYNAIDAEFVKWCEGKPPEMTALIDLKSIQLIGIYLQREAKQVHETSPKSQAPLYASSQVMFQPGSESIQNSKEENVLAESNENSGTHTP